MLLTNLTISWKSSDYLLYVCNKIRNYMLKYLQSNTYLFYTITMQTHRHIHYADTQAYSLCRHTGIFTMQTHRHIHYADTQAYSLCRHTGIYIHINTCELRLQRQGNEMNLRALFSIFIGQKKLLRWEIQTRDLLLSRQLLHQLNHQGTNDIKDRINS